MPFFRLLMAAPAVALAAVMLSAMALTGCATTKQAPIEERQPKIIDDRVTIASRTPAASRPGAPKTPPVVTGKTYTVRQGETLYSIASQNDLSPRDLANWNNIADPAKLSVGQVLRLTPPEGSENTGTASSVTTAPLQTVPPVTGAGSGTGSSTGSGATTAATPERGNNVKTEPKAEKQPYSEQALLAMSRSKEETAAAATASTAPPPPTAPPSSATTTPPPGAEGNVVDWSWPTQGKVSSTYSDQANFKGIDIVGSAGQPVVASAAGRVVYVGSGLRGYGKLVIIKHNDTFLSVYAHNRELLVQQSQQVTRGQKIAEMGNTDTDQVKLHFEIRKDGKPVDPMQYLPPR